MDLSSYLRPLRRYLVVTLLVTVLVGGATAFLVARSTKDTYQATLRLSLPTSGGQLRELDQTTADFVGEIGSPATVLAASQASGLSAGELDGALSAERLTQTGSQVQITATGSDSGRLAKAVTAAAQTAYAALARPRLEAAQSRQAKLQEAYQLVKNTPASAHPDPNQQRFQSQAEFAALRAVTDASSAVLDVQVQTQVLDDAATVNAVTIAPVQRTKQIVQSALTNAGSALFALVALLVAVELWRTRPSRRDATRPHPGGASFTEAAMREGAAGGTSATDHEDVKAASAVTKEPQELAAASVD